MKKKHYVILGAGISGLSLAWYLKKQTDANITILEKSDRPGGWIHTVQQDGFLFEQGPRSCRPYGEAGIATLKLIEELNLQDQILFASPDSKKRYIYSDQKLHCLPTSIYTFFTSPFRNSILKAIWKDVRTPKIFDNDESIYDFISRRLGASIAEQFFDPLVSGIYAGDIRQLSIKSCFPIFKEWEENHGSILKGSFFQKKKSKHDQSEFIQKARKQGIYTLQNGMETLVKVLSQKLQNELRLNCTVVNLHLGNGKTEVMLSDGVKIIADRLYSTVNPYVLGNLIASTNGSIAQKLQSIPSTSVAVVNVGYKKQVLSHEGFGYLVPSKENEQILGVVWDSCVFPQQNQSNEETRLTIMIGGTHMKDSAHYQESWFEKTALQSLRKHLLIKENPKSLTVKIAHYAIPQYNVGHSKKVQELQEEFTKLPAEIFFGGNGFYGVSVNDCIYNSCTAYHTHGIQS